MTLVRHIAALVAALVAIAAMPAAAAERTLSFVIYDWSNAIYQTRYADECPEGLAIGNDEYWWRSLSKADRAKHTNNGLLESGNRYNVALKRGPNQENACLDPTIVKDPGHRIVEGPYGFGENIDGNDDGGATPNTCAHRNFTTPDGVPGIDNQMYRLIGCTYGWRESGLVDTAANELRLASGLAMVLVEIDGITDPRNSPEVTVTFYRSIDQFILDGSSKPLPFATYRIDTADGQPRYADKLKGRIVDGVLTTERGDVRLPYYGNYSFINPVIRDFKITLAIDEDGVAAKGMITGYYDVDQFVHYVGGLGGIIPISYYSCPAVYEAAHRLADGYPDPATGKCTALSSAFNVAAKRAFILHQPQRNAEAGR